MKAAALDKRVGIEVRARSRDASTGELVDSWATSPLAPQGLWAQMLDVRSTERYAASQEIAEVSAAYRLRWSPALLTLTPDEHRLTWNGFTFNIRGVVEIQRRQGVVVLCSGRAEGRTARGLAPAV